MGLSDSIQAGVAAARAAVADLLVDVIQTPATGTNETGIVYGDPIPRQAIVEDGQTEAESGGMVPFSTAKLTFLEPIPVTADDTFEVPPSTLLPRGIAGEVLRMYSPLDGRKRPILTIVWLGSGAGA
jgi:hypothetical protein